MSSGIKPNGSCRKLKLPQKKSRTIFEQRPQVSPVFNACASRILVVGNYRVVATKPKSAVSFYVNGVACFTFSGMLANIMRYRRRSAVMPGPLPSIVKRQFPEPFPHTRVGGEPVHPKRFVHRLRSGFSLSNRPIKTGTCRDVCDLVAIGGEADVARNSLFGSDRPISDIR
jgi:hypothetical protein